MTLTSDDIAHLQRERAWYLEQIEAVTQGTYGVTRMEAGNRVDDDAGTLAIFRIIVANIEAVLTIAKA